MRHFVLRPGKRLIGLWTGVFALAGLATAIHFFLPSFPVAGLNTAVWLAVAAGVVSLLDALWWPKPGTIQVSRHIPQPLIQGRPARISLTFRTQKGGFWQKHRYSLLVADHFPRYWSAPTYTWLMTIQPSRINTLEYTATPMQRGEATFGVIEYWLPSRGGLWWRRRREDAPVTVKVLPDFSRILGEQFVGLQRWLQWVGVKPVPRNGLGMEFHQLRDYREGDDIRHIDWKASDRLNRLIVRSFQQEQDQQIIFLLDCGRSMRVISDGFTHFDHALQAMLLLSYTALKQGDAVGLHTFAHEKQRFVPPHKNLAQLGRLVQSVYDLLPSSQAADLAVAINTLLQNKLKRSLVVVLTYVQHSEQQYLIEQLMRLKKHHDVLLASLQPRAVQDVLNQPVETALQADDYYAAWQQKQREIMWLRQLQARDIAYIVTDPKELNSRLINHYLRWQRS